MKRFLLVLMLIMPLAPNPGVADDNGGELFAMGAEAFDGGDYLEALLIWHEASQLGNTDAMTSLADMLYRGIGVPIEIDTAIWWYHLAARLGDPVAQLTLGEFSFQGIGGETDPVKAYIWIGLAAEQGNEWAIQQRHYYARGLDSKALRVAEQLIDQRVFPKR